jgi:hypothetical protein
MRVLLQALFIRLMGARSARRYRSETVVRPATRNLRILLKPLLCREPFKTRSTTSRYLITVLRPSWGAMLGVCGGRGAENGRIPFHRYLHPSGFLPGKQYQSVMQGLSKRSPQVPRAIQLPGLESRNLYCERRRIGTNGSSTKHKAFLAW